MATKRCLSDGNWLMKDGLYWTNFTQCYEQNDTKIYITHHEWMNESQLLKEYLPLLKAIKEIGYSVSLITLIIAILIMLGIKKLHCTRNILHIHLFVSFILRASIFLVKAVAFEDGVGLKSDFLDSSNGTYFNVDPMTNNWQCKLLTSLWQYFTMANYSWILMEGLYLYNLIFRALFTDSNGSILGYVIMGWGIPFLVVSPWILARIFKEDTLCWTTTSSKIHLIIEIPTFISNIVNLIFFVRISSVLLKKLKSPLNDDNRKCYMKWAKSTLVLVPLFGINYVLLLGLKYIKNEVVELVWIAGDSLFGSFQGFFAAVLYCFLNGEVKTEIKPFLSTILPYLASSRLFGICFPCKEMFIRPTRGRISICTTLSCSSMYTNGLMHTRCSNSRNKDAHRCQHMKRLSQDAVTSDSAGTSVNMSLNRKQTCLHKMGTHDTSLEISDIEMKQSLEEYSFMLPRQC
ncbi:hypothetical protein HHI36_019559 [Cryptolaemus montrouzieri]|uniref:G-protein coupled receptors family 2 profile 2 domain-containing protein n=1 Tax=Cryptolaemus montrouzieri TaxID=559131 RepID=A0ABD2N7Z6_9CUCU